MPDQSPPGRREIHLGSLRVHVPATDHPELLAPPVLALLQGWARADEAGVVAIDPELADTAAMTDAYEVPLSFSANCVVVGGSRAGEERIAACVVLATTRADVNSTVKRTLDVRKASFLPMDRAVEATGMAYGGITPVGLPAGWRLLVDSAVVAADLVVVGSGIRGSKLTLPGNALADLPGAEIIEGLGRVVGTA